MKIFIHTTALRLRTSTHLPGTHCSESTPSNHSFASRPEISDLDKVDLRALLSKVLKHLDSVTDFSQQTGTNVCRVPRLLLDCENGTDSLTFVSIGVGAFGIEVGHLVTFFWLIRTALLLQLHSSTPAQHKADKRVRMTHKEFLFTLIETATMTLGTDTLPKIWH
jgi:hypothetical protein